MRTHVRLKVCLVSHYGRGVEDRKDKCVVFSEKDKQVESKIEGDTIHNALLKWMSLRVYIFLSY